MRLKLTVVLSLVTLLFAGGATWLLLGAVPALAAGAGMELDPGIWRWGMVAAAGATGLSVLAAAYAVAVVGSAAAGALAEKPELFGRLLIFVGLAEGIAIYGLIVSILILNRLG
ncbi:MAG: H+transporting two-sector ATPase C subunit [Nitrospirae bacterium CG18_big_fil_WC_8_21_14_2_50_70_55]|nr:H+transporting two-sector ATPase C subunit [Deltaproteobacteria bacterium]OIP65056.1 MAG: H+transporting two-sector ATPase C subunit [Nitrospirae bacterium CG2_30_70_394]PIQ04342.1 MAG: H+transporting two-sector ATPase C subunit [Nitrospirae bacterium CG18_big_fil_WC_8_21_14_2_50_70_55]PIU79061.1 MAG: H+transporting two-sector ATPase C subunit [Nitrospirae bacterium CG06_land_8_20_14_3_00_70_43]PIW82446.1 MAG: H+transporting two-sector ATPase C subunit [Nitrospirae bacterium CG_4_8_14_3_um_f